MVLDRYHHITFFDEPGMVLPSVRRHRAWNDAAARPSPPESPAIAPEAAAFFTWLLSKAGISLHSYRGAPLARRLRACLRSLHVRSLAEARAKLEEAPEHLHAAISALLIGVTEFFRDRQVFAYLQEVVLPELAAGRQGLRVWSAGCADGAELYSVAIMLAQHGLLATSYLVGTDCRADAIDKARLGWFDEHSPIERLDPALRETYFVRERGGWRAGAELRLATRWVRRDLLAPTPPDEPAWDLILCRNVAIYLQPSASAALWARLAGNLREGGGLVVGKAERPEGRHGLRRLAPCVYQKRNGGNG